MASDNEKYDVKGLEYGFLIFGICISDFSVYYTVTDGFGFLFAVRPKGTRLMAIPGVLILAAGLIIVYFSFKKMTLSKKKEK